MINYCRAVKRVKCNSCSKEANDIDVEKYHTKEVELYSFEAWTTMDCECGGIYKYI